MSAKHDTKIYEQSFEFVKNLAWAIKDGNAPAVDAAAISLAKLIREAKKK